MTQPQERYSAHPPLLDPTHEPNLDEAGLLCDIWEKEEKERDDKSAWRDLPGEPGKMRDPWKKWEKDEEPDQKGKV